MTKKKFIPWIRAAGIRAVKTVAETAIGVIGTTAVMQDVNWLTAVSSAVLAGIISLLVSIKGLPELKE